MHDRNRRFLLRERPSGRIGPDTFELSEEAVPEIGDSEALVRVDWISLDPTNRAWLNDTPTYLPPVGIGEVMRALGLGEVVASKNPNYAVGQTVQGLVGWQEYAVASDAMPLLPVDVADGVSPSAYLGALGMTGLTAWIGIRDIGKPQPGETVVVSAAAGAVGSVAGQLAKSDGARIVGIAGGPEKVGYVQKRIDSFEKRWRDSYPAAVRCLLDDRDSLTVYLRFPREHWTRVRHSNFIERTFGETRRRVKVIGRLPGEHCCLKLVWAVLDRASTGWRGFTMTPAGLRLLADLRRSLHDPPARLPQRNPDVHTETGVGSTDSAAIA